MKTKLSLKPFRGEDKGAIQGFLLKYPYKPYQYFIRDNALLAEYMWEKISDIASQSPNEVAFAVSADSVVGLAAVERLPWDSEHFGLNCGRISYLLAEGEYQFQMQIFDILLTWLDRWCSQNEIMFLSCKCNSFEIAAIHSLEKWGAKLMDDELTLAYPRGRKTVGIPSSNYVCKGFYNTKIERIDVLKKLGASFAITRFGLDDNIPKAKSIELWEKSIENSFRGFADQVIVAYDKGTPVGFIVVKADKISIRVFPKGVCLLFLAAVVPEYRGRWVGNLIYRSALKWGLENVGFVEGETQSRNYQTIGLYNMIGFNIVLSKFSFHKWF